MTMNADVKSTTLKLSSDIIRRIFNVFVIFVFANIISLSKIFHLKAFTIAVFVVLFLFVHILPTKKQNLQTFLLRNSESGCELLWSFLISTTLSIIYSLVCWTNDINIVNQGIGLWVANTIFLTLAVASVFWNGIIRIYLTSKQLGLRFRILGIIFGWVPVANLVVLFKLIQVVRDEIKIENEKILLNKSRESEQICKTKYPLLMIHGVFFRDSRYLNYWGRIPKQLEQNGATIFYGNHHSATSVEDSAEEIAVRVKEIISQTGCEKINIIAHSKGGLDCRYAIAKTDIAPYVASLTTINTPHRGCEFADYLLSKIPKEQQLKLADTYNKTLIKLGEANPDFLDAVYSPTEQECKVRNEIIQDDPNVYYQSVGSKLNRAMNGRFPLNFTYPLVNYFDGDNDGLVGEKSFQWGENYQFLTTSGKRGISHGDIIDLNRENFDGFDVREFYVQLVHDLKEKGF